MSKTQELKAKAFDELALLLGNKDGSSYYESSTFANLRFVIESTKRKLTK